MKPEAILQSDMLDILFENKNKEYGAYALRKNYNKRLFQAVGVTCLFVGLFVLLQSMKPKEKIDGPFVYNSTTIDLQPNEVKPKQDPPKEKTKSPKVVPTIADILPVIKPDVETTVPDIDSLNGRKISTIATGIITDPSDSGPGEIPINEGGGTKPAENETEAAPNGPLDFAEVMPAFNGDIKKFMLRNLRQPDDIEEGQRIVVKVKFLVTAEGDIDEVQVMQSGRTDLDQEVIRVVKKMPRWKPGMQSGRSVPVYFYLPVTFVSNAE